MGMQRHCLILTQYRSGDEYNDFIGKYYHFPVNSQKNYIKQFENLPIEIVYYEPDKHGTGVFYGYGKITKKPFIDKRDNGFFFAEIENYKPFSTPVSFKDDKGEVLEKTHNTEYYNYNNTVRKINPQFLDELCLDGCIVLNIESDAHLIKVLGEQLIGSEKVGILELIKNAIDAGASYCRVRLEKIQKLTNIDADNYEYLGLGGPVIIVEDDGCGMSKEVIENGWLRPASTIKTNIKEQLKRERQKAAESGSLGGYDALLKQLQKEHGRIPLGEKGVGRFATHRLGRYLELRTKTADNPYELVLKIDWNEFDKICDNFINLNSIGISLTRSIPTRDFGSKNSGTKLVVYGGREGFSWDEKIISELNRSIINLKSPTNFKLTKLTPYSTVARKYPAFETIFECPQMLDLPKTSVYEESTPNFTLDLLVDTKGVAIYELKFKHPEDKLPPEVWNGENFDLRFYDDNDSGYWQSESDKKRKPECGAFYLNIKAWYRTKEWIDIQDYKELTDYMETYGGITIYRDGVLMLESKSSTEFDWLGLNREHIKQGFRISYRDFIGVLEIDQGTNYDLVDKTNREGFIDNQAARDLATLIKSAIKKILFPKYLGKRDLLSQMTKGIISNPKTLSQIAKTSSTFFSNVSNSDYPLETDPYKFFADLWEKAEEKRQGVINLTHSMKELQKSIKMMEDVQDLFVEQAGFGIAVSISLHEINKITSNFYNGITELIKSGDADKIKLEDLKTMSASLRSELKRLSPLRSIRNERSIVFCIGDTIRYAHEVFKRKIETESIDFTIHGSSDGFYLFGRYSTLTQVFGNLFDNSIYWVKYSDNESRKISIFANNEQRTIIFADSGSGVNDIIRPNLFQPGYSLKEPPSGLGLFICKTYLDNMKARIYETPNKDRVPDMSGAQFTLDFSKSPKEGA